MDSITQAALGAAIAQATLGKRIGPKAAIAGAIVATIPDLDVFLRLFYNSYDMLRIHRGISHSLLFGVVAALILSFIFQRFKLFSSVSLLRLWWFNALCLITHSLLDFCTSYGTQLFLPFSDARLGLDTINVVDPVYTIPLLLGTFMGMLIPNFKPQAFRWNALGLVISSTYLVCTFGIKMIMNDKLDSELSEQHIEWNAKLTMPVGIAGINWYGLASTNQGIFIKKYSLLNNDENRFEFFPQNDSLLAELQPEVAQTMRWFAKGFYTVESTGDTIRVYNLQVDMRGMMLDRNPPAPTMGYFEFIKSDDGNYSYGYSSLK